MSQVLDESLEAGRAAIKKNAWREGYELLKKADHQGLLTADDLEKLGEAAWWIGNMDDCIAFHERAYTLHLEAGNRARAGYMAVTLARHHFNKLEQSMAFGWIGKAERLFSEIPESPEHGYLSQLHTMAALDMGDLQGAQQLAQETIDIGTRYGDRDLQAFGLEDLGRALIGLGRVEEGIALIDEATVAAVGGETGPLATGVIYCRAISACSELADYRRAGEWTDAARRWCERQSIAGGFPGVCRVHRAEIIRLRGDWGEAELEARRAVDELGSFMQAIASEAFYEIGEVRLRIGDLPAAEEAFLQAHEMMREPEPGLSLLRLAEGKVESASKSIKRAVDGATEPLRRAKMLPAQVLIAIEAGDLDTARKAADEMAEVAERFTTAALRACAECARGQVLLAEGNPSDALLAFKRAIQHWKEVDAPYEIARVRVFLGKAYLAEGDEDGSKMEFQAAKTAFDKLGAGIDSKLVAGLLGGDGATMTRGTAPSRAIKTLMFTDIVKSTNLLEAIGDDAWQHLLRWHDQTLRSLFSSHGGEEVKQVGDGFVVAFAVASEAVESAVAIQRALADHRKAHGFSPQVRIGLHTAEVTRKGMDYEGRGVHEAARIGALAEGGEILASAETYSAGNCRFPASAAREVTLKGISNTIEIVAIDWR